MRILFAIFALMMLGVGVDARCAAQTVTQNEPQDEPAESLLALGEIPAATGIDGEAYDLLKDDIGQVLVLIFVRTDCPISNRYAPVVRRLHERFQPRGVGFFLVYVDPDETPESMREHLREFGYPCPGLFDPEHLLVKHTGATVTPEAAVFNRQRQLSYRGRIDDLYADFGKARAVPTRNDLQVAIDETLDHRPVQTPVTKAIGCYITDLE